MSIYVLRVVNTVQGIANLSVIDTSTMDNKTDISIPPLEFMAAARLDGQVIIRRFTNELKGQNELELSTKAAQVAIVDEEESNQQKRLKALWESPTDSAS